MEIIADLHLHSKHSRATSKNLDIDNLEKWSRIKGTNLLGTGDFTHPIWIKELKNKLTEENGILKTKTGMKFILSTEVSLIYTDIGKGRRIHVVLLAPSFEIVDQITEYLLTKGRVDYDGRPIFKIPCDQLAYDLKNISDEIEIIPAHIWTPWFALLGSMGGYDSVQDAFKDQTKHIYALETGLSSDPEMNWRLSQLDKYALVSFSDAHSFWPWRIGREATIFNLPKLTYKNLIKAIRTKEGLTSTIEVNPGYGKYHEDGHRNCNVCLTPKETLKLKSICPKCNKPLTIGVHHRVESLADREEGFHPKNPKPYETLIPLSELISNLVGTGIATKRVWAEFNKLHKAFGSELDILRKIPEDQLNKITHKKITQAILKNRKGEIKIIPGYDGVYGIPKFTDDEIIGKQSTLGAFVEDGL